MSQAVIRGIATVVAGPLRLVGRVFDSVGVALQGERAYIEKGTSQSDDERAHVLTFAVVDRTSRFIPLKGKQPKVGYKVFVAPNASVVGDVSIGSGSTIGYASVLRGIGYIIFLHKCLLGLVRRRCSGNHCGLELTSRRRSCRACFAHQPVGKGCADDYR